MIYLIVIIIIARISEIKAMSECICRHNKVISYARNNADFILYIQLSFLSVRTEISD